MIVCRAVFALLLMFGVEAAMAMQWNMLSAGSLSLDSSDPFAARYIGSGLQLEIESGHDNWIHFYTASQFIDANQNQAYLAGGGMARRFLTPGKLRFDIGLLACAMQRKDYRDAVAIPALVPTVSMGSKRYALNFSYVNNVQYELGKVWFLQLKIAQDSFWP